MNWRNFFKSSHTLWLEKEIDRLHAEHVRQLTEQKNTYAAERERDISEISRLRAEVDRLRLHLRLGPPEVHAPQIGEDDAAHGPTSQEISYAGTPWQRILRRGIQQQEEEAKRPKSAVPEPPPVPASETVES